METRELERLVEVEQRSKSNTHRIDALQNNIEALSKIAKSVEIMAVELKHITKQVDTLDKKMSGIEKLPADRFNLIIDKLITGVIGALAGALCALFIK